MLIQKKQSFSYCICALYLALAPISWFPGVPVGFIKRTLLLLLIICNYRYFKILNAKGIIVFVFAMLSLTFSMLCHNDKIFSDYDSYIGLYLGLIENFIMFVVGYNFIKNGIINNKFFKYIVVFLGVISSITIFNYYFHVPQWYAPSQFETETKILALGHIYEKRALFETGFSWSRAGWGNSLALYIPLCFIVIMRHRNRKHLILLALFFSIYFSGTRNGVLASIMSILLYLYLRKWGTKEKVSLIFFIAIIFIVLQSYTDNIMMAMRLEGDNITSGRYDQFLLIPELIGSMNFWGIGVNGTAKYVLDKVGEEHQIHNTFFNTLIEVGWLLGGIVLLISVHVVKICVHIFRKQNEAQICYALILLSGLFASLFEPRMVFGSLGGQSLWWFVFGILTYYCEDNIKSEKL